MGRSSDKKTNQLLQTQRSNQAAEHAEDRRYITDQSAQANQRSTDMYNSMFGGLSDFVNNGGITDADKERMRNLIGSGGGGGGGGGGGSYGGSPIDIGALGYNEMEQLYRDSITGKSINQAGMRVGMPTFQELMKNGGYTPEMLESLGGSIGLLKQIADTGGVDPDAQARMRGGGVYDEYALTGGIDPRTETLMRQRATSTIPAMYDRMKEDTARRARMTGSTAGTSALMAKMGRESARESANAARDAELGIYDRRDEGRRWGTAGMTASEGALQQLMSGNRLNAANSAIGAERGIGEFIANTKGSAAKSGSDVESNIQTMLTDERRYGMGGLQQIIQERIAEQQRQQAMAAAAAEADAARADADWRERLGLEQYLLESGNEGRLAGLEGMGRLYESGPGGATAHYDDMRLRERGLTGELEGQNIGQQAANRGTSWKETAGNILGAAVPAAIGAFTGGGFGMNRLKPVRTGMTNQQWTNAGY